MDGCLFFVLISVFVIILKTFNVITLSWWFVLAPIYLPFILAGIYIACGK